MMDDLSKLSMGASFLRDWERVWVGCLEITGANGKKRVGGEAAKQASLEELRYGHMVPLDFFVFLPCHC